MIVTLFDYGTGNLHSLTRGLEAGGATVRIAADPETVLGGDALVLPGVGAFSAAARQLEPAAPAIRDAVAAGFPCLGICLGMQLLFESSDEGPGTGLGVLAGHVRRLRAPRIPQMGWNDVEVDDDPLFAGVDGGGPVVYYANSFVADPVDASAVIGWTVYGGDRFAAAVRKGRTWGVQFHPEKSSAAGLGMIRNFLTAAGEGAPR